MLNWERVHGIQAEPETDYQEWFADCAPALLLLPTTDGWEALAYIHWYAAELCGSKNLIALGRSWQQRFGAELIAQYGTILQCRASRPPSGLDEAWQLASEQDLVAGCTLALPGVSLRDHARYLLKHERWFLHERP